MNKIGISLMVFVLCAGSLPRLCAQEGDRFSHTVERGQTVYSIAAMYGVSVEDIYRLNPESMEGVKAGSVLGIPRTTTDEYIYHTIQAKETLFSLTTRYSVPATEIVRANPGLSVSTFTTGRIIRIPSSGFEKADTVRRVIRLTDYKVGRRETLYQISRKFNIPTYELLKYNPGLEEDRIKAGASIKIPEETGGVAVAPEREVPREQEVNAMLSESRRTEGMSLLKVALLLPFTTRQASAVPRFVEYYEGLLMAVDSLRGTGLAIELSVFDTGDGTGAITGILKNDALLHADLIVGAVQNEQIRLVAGFAREHQIKYVVPFTSQNDDVLSNANVFQVNTPHSYLYSKASQAGCDLFGKDNIIIIHIAGGEDKSDFIRTFMMEMQIRNIPYREISYAQGTFPADVRKTLDAGRRNIVLLSSSSQGALNKVKTPLRMLTEATPGDSVHYDINLFGYPDWQTYTQESLEDFHAMNTCIYSHFHADNLSPRIQQFYSKYKDWYSKNLINTFPKYGMLGFDTGMFFFDAMRRYGKNFQDNLGKVNYDSLQTGFAFERVNNWGGFINTNVFIIQYRDDYTIARSEVR
jgi:LysM repeat protein